MSRPRAYVRHLAEVPQSLGSLSACMAHPSASSCRNKTQYSRTAKQRSSAASGHLSKLRRPGEVRLDAEGPLGPAARRVILQLHLRSLDPMPTATAVGSLATRPSGHLRPWVTCDPFGHLQPEIGSLATRQVWEVGARGGSRWLQQREGLSTASTPTT